MLASHRQLLKTSTNFSAIITQWRQSGGFLIIALYNFYLLGKGGYVFGSVG